MLSKFKENMIATKYSKNYDGCNVIMVLFAQHSIKHYNTEELFLTSKKKTEQFFFQIMRATLQGRELSDILNLL